MKAVVRPNGNQIHPVEKPVHRAGKDAGHERFAQRLLIEVTFALHDFRLGHFQPVNIQKPRSCEPIENRKEDCGLFCRLKKKAACY